LIKNRKALCSRYHIFNAEIAMLYNTIMFFARKNPTEATYTTIVAGQRLHYRVIGEGPPLVLIHGYGTSGYIWQRLFPYFEQTHQLFMLDLPGYGRSAAPLSWQLRAVAPLIGEWLDIQQLPPVTLMGHSMGGAISIHLTAIAPAMVKNLILVNTAGLPLQAPLPQLALRATLSAIQPGNGSYSLAMIRDFVQPRIRVLWQTALEMVDSDMRAELASITTPTLIIWGERDLLIPISLGRALSQALPHATFVTLPECGHRPMLGQPARFSTIVKEFLQREETTSQS
jgi:pimeloyl-ACP methyl ester carboxylesterase